MPKLVLAQPWVALGAGSAAVAAAGALWTAAPPALPPADLVRNGLLAAALVAATVLAYRFPVHTHYRLKIELSTVPIYLLSVLLPPPLAVLGAGMAMLLAELSVRRQHGTYLSDIVTQTGRIMLAVLVAASFAAVLHPPGLGHLLILLGAAVLLWGLDALTIPLVLAPVTHEPPLQIIRVWVREGGVAEGTQYLLGLLGAVVAGQEPLALLLLLIPMLLVNESVRRSHELQTRTLTTLETMADEVDERDPYTGGHSRRVAEWCAGILRALPMNGPDAQLILTAARLHDIGKIGIPAALLNKPGGLTAEERAIMETHAARGAELLKRFPDFARGAAIVRHHHEAWDGSGYPAGLKGTTIPLGARIVAVADSFDAMTSDRPYRRGLSRAQTFAILHEGRGKQWDAEIVDAFVRSLGAGASAPARPAETAPPLPADADFAPELAPGG